MTSHRFDRPTMLDALRGGAGPDGDPFDVLVVGGGITGVGVALDAAARGLSVALVERDDFASGTSSKSSKLVHGGLRYLQNGDVRLVYEALRERRRLMRNAPNLVHLLPFMIPVMTRDGVIGKKIARALGSAMWMYDLTGGWRIGKLHRRIGAAEAMTHFPTTHEDKVSAAYLYYDAAADDARLTLTIARTAAERGAVLVNRCAVVAFTHDAETGRTTGVVARDVAAGSMAGEFTIAARAIVNAAGVWVDEVRALDEGRHPDTIRPAKGVHITIPWTKVRNDIAVVIPVRRDKRSLFLVPWGPLADGTFQHTYVGTTDTDFSGVLDDPQCDADDIDYILEALNQSITTTVDRSEITGVWAGLRPLVRSAPDESGADKTKDLSRRHAITISSGGVVTVTGGKLTTYREMAQDTVDAVIERLRELDHASNDRQATTIEWMRRRRRHPTQRMNLFGTRTRKSSRPMTVADQHLHDRYGSAIDEIRALVAFDADLDQPLVPGQPYLRAEAVYAARREMATTLDDVMVRRTRAHLFDRAACRDAAPSVADLLAAELGWDGAERDRQIDHYLRLCADEEAAGEQSIISHAHATD